MVVELGERDREQSMSMTDALGLVGGMRISHSSLGLLLLVLSGFVSRAAAATPEAVDLAWSAEHGCLDQAALTASVERTLGRAVFHGDGEPRVTITGVVGGRFGCFPAGEGCPG